MSRVIFTDFLIYNLSMDTFYLRNFLSVAKYLNFTKAAAECGLTQTAMSTQIFKMEEELGFKLFERNNRTVRLTKAGEQFFIDTTNLIETYNSNVDRARRLSEGSEGLLKIGFPNYTGRIDLPEITGRFSSRYPEIGIEISQNENWILLDQLKYNKTDIVQTFPYDLESIDDVKIIQAGSFRMNAAVSVNHKLANEKEITVEMINEETVIIHEDAAMPELNNRMYKDWAAAGIFPKNTIRTKGLDSILFMVEAGYGISFIPVLVKPTPTGSKIRLLQLKNLDIKMDIVLAYRKSNTNPVLKKYVEFASEYYSFNNQQE